MKEKDFIDFGEALRSIRAERLGAYSPWIKRKNDFSELK